MVPPHRTVTITIPTGIFGPTKAIAALDGLNTAIQSNYQTKLGAFLGSMTVTPSGATDNHDGTVSKVLDIALGPTFFDKFPTSRSQIQALGSTVVPLVTKKLNVRASAVVS